MSNENVSMLNVSVYEGTPRDLVKGIEPTNAVNRAWIPQSMGDCVWIVYEFANEADRIAWEEGLPGHASKWLWREGIEYAKDFGWGTRDFNGWLVDRTESPSPPRMRDERYSGFEQVTINGVEIDTKGSKP